MPRTDEPTLAIPGSAWTRLAAGPVVTLVWIGVVHFLQASPLHFPNAALLVSLAIVWAAYYGGLLPGLLSAAIGIAYSFWSFSEPGQALVYTDDDLRRLPVIVLTFPALAVLVGTLRSRANRAMGEAAARRADELYREVFERAADAIFISEPDGRYRFVNRTACALTGFSAAELCAMRMSDLVAPADLQRQPFRITELHQQGSLRTERRIKRRDGSSFVGEVSASVMPDGRLLGIVREVTSHHEAMEKLGRALSLQQATLDATTDGLLVVDHQGRWAGYNQRLVEMWRMPRELAAHGEDARAIEFVMSQLAKPELFLQRVRELYATPEAASFDEFEFKDGRVFERYSLPQMLDGVSVGRVWSFRDVTAVRRQAQALRESDRRWQQAQKLEALGRLAGGVAHDFNNMLMAILGETEVLANDFPQGSAQSTSIENIRGAALRSAQLTRQLLTFGRRQSEEPRRVLVVETIRGLDSLTRRLLGAGVELAYEFPEGEPGPAVFVDRSQMEQAVLNLVINAHDAMPNGGALRVCVGRAELSREEAQRRGAPQAGRYATIEVVDSGLGIPEHVRPHLFEPFFTTKDPGKGTGLGLASVYGTVEQAGGFIEVESELGQGSTFRVLLPLSEPPSPAGTDLSGAAHSNGDGRGKVVLLAEDEPAVRTFVAAVLRHFGCEVLEAASGEEALERSRSHPGEVALLLSDVVMPNMYGTELAEVLRRERPGIRVQFMSGYPGEAVPGDPELHGDAPLLAKPFSSQDLIRRLSELLGSAA